MGGKAYLRSCRRLNRRECSTIDLSGRLTIARWPEFKNRSCLLILWVVADFAGWGISSGSAQSWTRREVLEEFNQEPRPDGTVWGFRQVLSMDTTGLPRTSEAAGVRHRPAELFQDSFTEVTGS